MAKKVSQGSFIQRTPPEGTCLKNAKGSRYESCNEDLSPEEYKDSNRAIPCSTRKTLGGHCCVFPFIYREATYKGCTTENHYRPWCSLTADYEKDTKWDNCKACSTRETITGQCCVFPFTYDGKVYQNCTEDKHNRPWCSLTANYEGKWDSCKAPCKTKETITGQCCAFPFTHGGKKYQECTEDGNAHRPWCSMTADYEGKWDYCKVSLKIGLYNKIPDINNDNLTSYSEFISAEWRKHHPNIELQLSVKPDQYDPYGDLEKYLGYGEMSFDLIETDMANYKELKGKVLEIRKEVDIKPDEFFKATIDAVKDNEKYLGYPTLACGNFIIETQNDTEQDVELEKYKYGDFLASITLAKFMSKHKRLIGGTIDDSDGWYLPFIYLDGVIDIKGPGSLRKEIKNVMDNNPDQTMVQRLKTFFVFFKDSLGEFDKNDKIIQHVADRKNGYFFGFSETLSEIIKVAGDKRIRATKAIVPPFGEDNFMLVFTDALVINKIRFMFASQAKKKALKDFAKFFTSENIRHNFVIGKDMKPEKIRYLLPPIKSFYRNQDVGPLYKAYGNLLERGVSAPALTDKERKRMEEVLKPIILG